MFNVHPKVKKKQNKQKNKTKKQTNIQAKTKTIIVIQKNQINNNNKTYVVI